MTEVAKRGPNWKEPRELTDEEYRSVLDYIREHQDCSNREACAAVGIRREDFRDKRESDKRYDDDYREARGYGDEQLVNTFRKLAVEGVLEPIVSAGKVVRDDAGNILYKRIFSDRLVELGLKMHTAEGKALVANKLGIEINTGGAPLVEVQGGVSTAEVFEFMRQHVRELEAPEGTGEVTDVRDEQL